MTYMIARESEKGMAYYDDGLAPWWAYDRDRYGTRYLSRGEAEAMAKKIRAKRGGRIYVIEI